MNFMRSHYGEGEFGVMLAPPIVIPARPSMLAGLSSLVLTLALAVLWMVYTPPEREHERRTIKVVRFAPSKPVPAPERITQPVLAPAATKVVAKQQPVSRSVPTDVQAAPAKPITPKPTLGSRINNGRRRDSVPNTVASFPGAEGAKTSGLGKRFKQPKPSAAVRTAERREVLSHAPPGGNPLEEGESERLDLTPSSAAQTFGDSSGERQRGVPAVVERIASGSGDSTIFKPSERKSGWVRRFDPRGVYMNELDACPSPSGERTLQTSLEASWLDSSRPRSCPGFEFRSRGSKLISVGVEKRDNFDNVCDIFEEAIKCLESEIWSVPLP